MGLPATFCHAKWAKWGNASDCKGIGQIRKNARRQNAASANKTAADMAF
jgi:hypothetical protein